MLLAMANSYSILQLKLFSERKLIKNVYIKIKNIGLVTCCWKHDPWPRIQKWANSYSINVMETI